MRQLLVGTILGLGLILAIGTGPSARVAVGEELGVTGSAESWFLVFSGSQRVGQAWHKVTRAYDTVILEEKFWGALGDKPMRFESLIIYNTSKPVGPTEAKVTTYGGATKLMEAAITFVPADGGGRNAHVEMTGFADKNEKALDPPQKKVIDMPVPDGLLLMQQAIFYLAPRLLQKDGKIENVVYARFPESTLFPTVIAFKPDFVMERTAGEGGRSEIDLKTFAKSTEGTKTSVGGKVVVNAQNEVVEYSWGKFNLKVSTAEEAAPPAAEVPPPTPAKTPKPAKRKGEG